jgi:transposase
VSGLDELTREELIALVLKLHETVEYQAKRIAELEAIVQAQAERISELEEEIARIKGGKSGALEIKASVKKKTKEKATRKKRMQSFARESRMPSEVVCHAVDECPNCGRELDGGTVKWKHQVVDAPAEPIKITDHLFIERRCGVCGTRCIPNASEVLGELVVGKRTIGIGLMSLIAYLKIVCRVPVGLIRQLLESLYGLSVSKGEICELLHEVARLGKDEYDGLLESVRGSPVVHGDETGWREDGVNGYLWSFSTPRVRYFTYNRSRAGAVVKEVLDKFVGALVADFYGGYNIYDGIKQRCWIHFLRDLAALAEKHEIATAWVDSVKDVYYRARATVEMDYSDKRRCELRQNFEVELLALAQPYLNVKSAPQRVLAKRIDRFLDELFPFVQYPEIPSENNAAERAVRPAVIARKVSGGTRSAKGSQTNSILRSLFETWALQGQNTISACREMIVASNRKSLPQN